MKAVLEKIGYVATTATEFSLVKKRNNEETKQTAFELFLARIECEAILEMTNEEKHGNLEKSLQKGTQTHQQRGEEDEEDQTPQRGDMEGLGNEGTSETPVCLAPQQECSAACAASFEAAGIKGDGAQSVAATSPSSLQEHRRQGINTKHLPGKSSDSEDFLIKYSDIVIGQTPIFSESLSPKALEKDPRDRLGGECALAGAESAVHAPGPLSPGASGPPAFAMFADSCYDSKITLEFEAPGVPEGSIEAEISDAINCIDPAPSDEPTELKSLPYKDFASAQNCSIHREKDVCGLSLTFTELQIKDAQEELTYPVEETGQPEAVSYAGTSDRHIGEFNCSQIKHAYLTDAELHRRAASHTEPPSGLCCSAGLTENSTTSSDIKRLFMDPAKAHPASECFRHVREPPNLTYIPPQSIDLRPSHGGRKSLGQPAGDSAGGREGKLENCNSPETDTQEPYVIIDRTDQAVLCHHT